ncbi:hypothetical protein [Streptomyces sp. NPDC006193]|uniref:hypothetical protein n=1 Tax=Streptomyces sp. NPDC006193 TaxID=3155717 RepID=UPI0033A8EAD9
MRGSVTGTAITLAAGTLLTAAMTTASASPPPAVHRAAPPRPVLVDCLWHRTVQPTDFILACGDGNSRLTGLHWSQWSGTSATAVGVNMVNDCKPYCAAGTFRSYPVTVRLDGPQPWKKDPGVQHFTRMSLTYTGARPEGFQQVVTYPLWD